MNLQSQKEKLLGIDEIRRMVDEARKMGKKGRKIIGDEWNVNTMVKKIESLYASEVDKISVELD